MASLPQRRQMGRGFGFRNPALDDCRDSALDLPVKICDLAFELLAPIAGASRCAAPFLVVALHVVGDCLSRTQFIAQTADNDALNVIKIISPTI